jgi:hypothetical protein
MQKNEPICKLCYTNISDNVCIPCGHLFCKKCIILTKTFSPSYYSVDYSSLNNIFRTINNNRQNNTTQTNNPSLFISSPFSVAIPSNRFSSLILKSKIIGFWK